MIETKIELKIVGLPRKVFLYVICKIASNDAEKNMSLTIQYLETSLYHKLISESLKKEYGLLKNNNENMWIVY